MDIQIRNCEDCNWTTAVTDVAHAWSFVKRRTNRFYITHDLERLHKEHIAEVTGKYVINKHSDSALYRVIVLFYIYIVLSLPNGSSFFFINLAFPTYSPHARRNGGVKWQTVIVNANKGLALYWIIFRESLGRFTLRIQEILVYNLGPQSV